MKKGFVLAILIPALILGAALVFSGAMKPKASYSPDFTVNGTVLTKYNGSDASVVVPDGITEIGAEAFSGNPMVEAVALPGSVETIGYAAFSGCKNLKTVALPDGLLRIEDSAFNGDENLTTIDFGSKLSSLGSGVFGSCKSLSNIDISKTNTSFTLQDGAILNKELTTLYMYLPGYTRRQYQMPNSVQDIKRYAFWGTEYLEDVILSTGLKNVPDMAFANCSSLENLTAYTPLNAVGLRSFDTCTNLKQITLPTSVGTIHETAFNYCNPSLLFVCENGSYVDTFARNNGFQSSATPQYHTEYVEEPVVTNPSENTVSGNTIDEEEAIPVQNTVTTVEGEVLFSGKIVSDRAYIMFDQYTVNQGSVYSGDAEAVEKKLSIISDYAYYNSPQLKNFSFQDLDGDVEAIGRFSFARSGLTELVIPSSVVSIDYGAFYHCDDLKEVVIPASVTSIEAFAFDHTPWLDTWFNDDEASDFLVVGDGVLLAYKGNEKDVVLPKTVKHIAPNAFRDHKEIESVTLSDGIISIGAGSFAGCENMKMIHNAGGNILFEETSFEKCPVSL